MMLQKLNTAQKRGLIGLLGILMLFAGWRWNSYQSTKQATLDPAESTAVGVNTAPAKIDLNTADSTQLTSISGIGPTLANRIIRFRQRIGGFENVEQLLQITGIREGNFVAIEERVFADTTTANFHSLRANKPKQNQQRAFAQRTYSPQKYNHPQTRSYTQNSGSAAASEVQQEFQKAPSTSILPKKEFAVAPIDLNTADSATLVTVSGIGPSTARNILKHRALIFFFEDVQQLEEVWGIRPENLERMRPQLKIGDNQSNLPHLKINEMDVEALAKHKYMDFKMARILVAYREKHGPFKEFADFEAVLGIDKLALLKLEPYFSY